MSSQPRAPDGPSWGIHVMALLVLVVLAVTQWKPASPPAAPVPRAESAELAMRLGAAPADAEAIDEWLQSLNRFPPHPEASRALANALASCDMSSVDGVTRTRLAERLYTVADVTDATPATLPIALASIQQTLSQARCSPSVVDRVTESARQVAQRDPNPRGDWW